MVFTRVSDAFALVADPEPDSHPALIYERVQEYYRRGYQRYQSEFHVHGEHESHRQDQHDKDPDDGCHLLRYESAEHVNIRGASLDDVPGVVLHMPLKGQPLYMGEQGVSHGLGESLRALGIADSEYVLRHRFYGSHSHYRKRHDPQVLSESLSPSEPTGHGPHDGGHLIAAAYDIVYGAPQDLRYHHVSSR